MSTVSKEWITVAEAAKLMECSSRTVLRLAQSGEIRRVEVNPRLYLVHVADVEREAHKEKSMGRPRGT